jgi:hypothetical protein
LAGQREAVPRRDEEKRERLGPEGRRGVVPDPNCAERCLSSVVELLLTFLELLAVRCRAESPQLPFEVSDPIGLSGALGGRHAQRLADEAIEPTAVSTAVTPLPPLDLALGSTATLVPLGEQASGQVDIVFRLHLIHCGVSLLRSVSCR